MRIAILVMAAGYSSRFKRGGQCNKLTAMLNNRPVLQHTLCSVHETGYDVFVVTRPEDKDIHEISSVGNVLMCSSDGLGDSIAAGVSATSEYDGWLITLADMPFIGTSSYRAVGESLLTFPIVRSEVNGIQGHPVGFQKSYYPQLCSLKGDAGARKLLVNDSLALVHLQDLGCITDIDTPEDMIKYNRIFNL